jgi:hypothetical protein
VYQYTCLSFYRHQKPLPTILATCDQFGMCNGCNTNIACNVWYPTLKHNTHLPIGWNFFFTTESPLRVYVITFFILPFFMWKYGPYFVHRPINVLNESPCKVRPNHNRSKDQCQLQNFKSLLTIKVPLENKIFLSQFK